MAKSVRMHQLLLALVSLALVLVLLLWLVLPLRKKPGLDVVISHYNEDITQLDNSSIFGDDARVVLYSKGETHPPNAIVLPNVGKCDHTYLYHIVQNYDKLAAVTVFLPASCFSSSWKRMKMLETLNHAMCTCDSAILVEEQHHLDMLEELGTFQLDDYETRDASNRMLYKKQNLNTAIEKASIRPLRAWYRHYVGGAPLRACSYGAIFAISRRHIHTRSRDYYTTLLQQLSGSVNPEAGHYMERSWVSIFNVPDACLYPVQRNQEEEVI